jgi:sialate O-acetylesterase
MNLRPCLLALGLASFARADVTLPAIFSDHMVLQGGQSAAVWGWADPGEKIRVSIGEQEQGTRADEAGRWLVHLDPLPPGGPYRLGVKGRNKVTIDDVLVGEVWLGAGQSNMALPVESARDFPFERSRASLPGLRMFTVKAASANTAQTDCRGEWKVCSPETVGDFSATLYFFGREIQAALGTPVGLINSSVGGTRIESWISPEAQGATAEMMRDGAGVLFNGFIAPLTPCTLRGILWYQGESNAYPEDAPRYREQLPLLIADWRARRGEPELPFAWVQLPNLDTPHFDFVTIREGMREALQIPNTGMAITIDVGDPDDVHPRDKQTVGDRLSRWALGEVYGFDTPTSGPLFTGQTIFDDRIALSFTHTDGGLVAQGGSLPGFWIAGADRVWYFADAWIEGDSVVVANSYVKHPVAVRYGWENNPPCHLYNGAGLPASPFRTDDWP